MNRNWQPGHWRLHVDYRLDRDNFDLHLAYRNRDDRIQVIGPAQFFTKEHLSTIPRAPWISADAVESLGMSPKQFLQDMLDEAWDQGLRPTAFSAQKELVERLDNHLQDMRAIASHKLGVKLP